MNIVSNSFFLRNLRRLEFFNLNLGKTKKLMGNGKDKDTFRQLSEFEIKYNNLYNKNVMIFGNIGKATFYEDVLMENYKFLVFKDNDIYEIEWSEIDIIDMKNYILDTLRKIDEIDKIKEEQKKFDDNKNNYLNNDDVWISNDEKNKGKKYTVNQTLTKEEYRKQLLKKIESER